MQKKGDNTYLILFDGGARQKVTADYIQSHNEYITLHVKEDNGAAPVVASIPSEKVYAVIDVTSIVEDDKNWVNP